MSLYNYVEACREFMSELSESLTTEEIDALRADLAALGESKFGGWYLANLKSIVGFAASTPTARQKRRFWRDPILKPRMVYAALCHMRSAHRLLEGIERHGLYPGKSQRDLATAAGEAYFRIFYLTEDDPFDWPFDGPDPFQEP